MLQVTRACSVHQTSPFMTGDFGVYVHVHRVKGGGGGLLTAEIGH